MKAVNRDWTDKPMGAPPEPLSAPRAGHGTVFVKRNSDDTWGAVWQDDGRMVETEGKELKVKSWARLQPASKRLVFDETQAYSPLR